MLTVLVTGATNGIGLETARVLAGLGHSVLLHGRDERRGRAAVEAVAAAARAAQVGAAGSVGATPRTTGSAVVRFLQADFASLADVRRLAAEVNSSAQRLDVLINNAGGAQISRRVTADGYETTFAVNHLAPFLLTNLLLDKVRASTPSRIVNVASSAHRNKQLDFDDLMSSRDYKVMQTYGRSKLANIMFTRSLARQLQGTGVTVNSLHPGLVATGIGQSSSIGRFVSRMVAYARGGISIEEGAKTSVYLAVSPEVQGKSGDYYVECRPAPLRTVPEAFSDEACERLWKASEKLVGL